MFSTAARKYRHVVFADAINGSARAVNYGRDPWLVDEPQADTEPLSADEDAFVRWLLRTAGVEARHYRDETLRRRLPAVLRACRAGSLQHARAVLQNRPALLPAAVGALLIGVSSFFRDEPVFEALRDSLLPRLLHSHPILRVCSAGCSDGAELYTMAILLDQLGALRRSLLVGVDCRHDALARAAAGLYDEAALRSLPPELLSPYFRREAGGWRARADLRVACQWRCGDLLAAGAAGTCLAGSSLAGSSLAGTGLAGTGLAGNGARGDGSDVLHEGGTWHVILCRNVAIYLRNSATAALWQRLQDRLAPGGLLVLGKAERPASTNRLVAVAPCIYRRERD